MHYVKPGSHTYDQDEAGNRTQLIWHTNPHEVTRALPVPEGFWEIYWRLEFLLFFLSNA